MVDGRIISHRRPQVVHRCAMVKKVDQKTIVRELSISFLQAAAAEIKL